ncbi:MAG: PAS domain S-box protein, partial [Archaeoglobaceae archaeon]
MSELLKLINSHVRHDMLNDLTTIRSILEVYKDARNDELLENALKKIDGCADFLKEMREVESMVSEGELKPLKLNEALKPITEKYEENLNLNIEGDCRVMADDSLTSIFDNLMRNSITHGNADRVDIKVVDKDDVCKVEVADNGEGIPDDIKERVFEEGFSTNGTGLGLYIVKKTIERYGGSIHLKDNQWGTTFVMIFKTPVTQKQESRDSGIEVLGDIGWGTHICHFYQTRDDLTNVLIPYFKAGLDNNEYCMWITSKSNEEAQKLVEEQLPGVEHIKYDESYGERQLIDCLVEKLNLSLAAGYDGLRTAGDFAWLGNLKDFIGYEEDVNETIESKKIIVLCSYPFNKFKASEIADLTSRHHYTLVVREGEWEYIENFEYRRTQNILQKIEDKYRALVENANEGVIVIQDAMVVYVNFRVLEVSGYLQEEMMFKPFHEFIHPEDREFVFKHYKKRVNSAGTDTYQFRFINKRGETRWAEIKVTSIEWDGKPATLNLLTDITAQKEAKEKLQELKTSYQELFDKSVDAIFIHDPDTAEILDVNQKMCELYGYTREEALNLKVGDLSGGNYTNEKAKELVQKARTEGQQTFEWQGKKKDGTIFWEEVTLKKATIGGKERILASVRDITERKKSEQALKESEEKHRTYVDNSPVAIFVANERGEYVDVNNAACEMLGYTKEELLNMSIPQVAEDNENSLNDFEQLKSLGNYRGERRLKRKDGSLINVDLNAVVLENGDFMAFCSDITEKRMAQKRLKESEARYRNLFNYSNYAILIHDLEGKIVDANQKSLELTGYSKSEMLSLTVMDLTPLESIETVGQKFNKISRDGYVNFEIDYLAKDGGVRTVEISASIFESGGKSLVQSLARDITDKKRYELALKESEERYRQLVDNVMDIPYTLDIDGVITYIGPQVEQYGYNAQEIVGRDFTEIIHSEDVGQVRYNLQTSLETGEEPPSEFRINTPAMGLRWFEERGRLVKGGEGEVKRISGILRDVTERRQAEEHVEHLNSLLMAIRNVNQLIVQEQDLDKLLNGTCRLLLEIRGYLGCSIALLKDNAIVPVARAGAGAGAGEPQFLNYKDLSIRAEENTPECVKAV